VCFALGVTNSFYWNRHWTFPEASHRRPLGQYARFVLVSLIGVSLSQTVLAAALILGPKAGLDLAWCKWGGKVVAISVGGLWNFVANARWTFGVSRFPGYTDQDGNERGKWRRSRFRNNEAPTAPQW
jgi:putative flippase GtrA